MPISRRILICFCQASSSYQSETTVSSWLIVRISGAASSGKPAFHACQLAPFWFQLLPTPHPVSSLLFCSFSVMLLSSVFYFLFLLPTLAFSLFIVLTCLDTLEMFCLLWNSEVSLYSRSRSLFMFSGFQGFF